jgi:alpha-1,2-mannosyltransferase
MTEAAADAALISRSAADPAAKHGGGRRLLAWGAGAFAVSVAIYVVGRVAGWSFINPGPVDLEVYVDGGLIVRHVAPLYDGHLASPLYDWTSIRGLSFTYTPFAAVAFSLVSFIPWPVILQLSTVVSVAALAGSLWLVFWRLGYAEPARTGAALLASAAVFWIEPVQRTLFLGQVNLVLMLFVLLDLCLPDSVAGRWWKGTGIGIAAGIKLVPLVFIPYLLLTRRFRQAAVAAGVFCATIALGFAVIPRDSGTWWLHGLFLQSSRTGFPGVMENQSLHGFLIRLAGSVAAGQPIWLVVATGVGIAGIGCAALLDRAGYPVLGILACALTGLLISPISWDHHWVWIAPGLAVMGHYAVRSWRARARRAAAGLWALAAAVGAAFGAWPETLWLPHAEGIVLEGLIWAVPSTPESLYDQYGDQPWFREYHYQGLDFLAGNLYVLIGMGLFALSVAVTAVIVRQHARAGARAAAPGEADS